MKLAFGQINTTPMDIAGNVLKIAGRWDEAEAKGARIVFFPEQAVSGYPLEDRAINPDLLLAAKLGREALLRKSANMSSAVGIGYPEMDEDDKVYNVYEVIQQGRSIHRQEKHDLPNTDVFDEKRIYGEGPLPEPFELDGQRLGLLICEDTWHTAAARNLAAQGAQALISVNASPYYVGKQNYRLNEVLGKRIGETGLPIAYVNQVGGVDEVVFDGFTCAMNADRKLAMQAPGFTEGIYTLDLERTPHGAAFSNGEIHSLPAENDEIWQALVLGTRDYVRKSGFEEVVLGMSGGIDSAVVAAIAVDALGADKVHLVKLPSKYSSDHSISDSDDAAKMLGSPIIEIPIQGAVDAADAAVSPFFNASSGAKAVGVARENEQARVRGLLLMTLTNGNHWLLLSTGNKSEIAVGYCTLYGDMNGGFNPLKDVLKMRVYELAEYRNSVKPAGCLGPDGPAIPRNIILKKPSAELAPGQFDQDSLPPYPTLDPMLQRYVERDQPMAQVARDMNLDIGLVADILRKTDRAEFKRRQACPGLKITEKSFGKGRRVPIVGPSVPRMLNDALDLSI